MTLTLDKVAKRVGAQTHIHPISLTLNKGEINVLLGPTLAGKTTLMRLMAGLERPTEGRVLWEGADVTHTPVQKRNAAMVYQQFINYPAFDVYENIASPMRLAGMKPNAIRKRVYEIADILKIEPYLGRKPLELSGGQQQRCAIGRALAKNADLVLLDEPLANLDYKLREELREELPRIFAESGAIFVYATTEPHEALMLGGSCATLWQGRVTQFGPTPLVYRQPADADTARVFSDPPMNFMRLRKSGEIFTGADGFSAPAPAAARDLPDGDYIGGVRPNHLSLEPRGSEDWAFEAQVSVTEITGSESFIHLTRPGAAHENWVLLARGVMAPQIGETLRIYVNPAHIYLFKADGALAAPAAYAQAA